MIQPISLHVLCRYEGTNPKGMSAVDKREHIYDSVSWRIKEQDFEPLVGKCFFMHESKTQPSYLGGEIVDIRAEPIPDNDGEIRAIVRFKLTKEARQKTNWPATDNPNEYCRVNYDTPLDELRR
jgi:hypothetical protein